MMDRKYLWELFSIFLMNIMFAKENTVLWDFGVIITSIHNNNSKQHSTYLPDKHANLPVQGNALISDSYIPPIKIMVSENTFTNEVYLESLQVISATNINKIKLMIGKLSIQQNYLSIINILGQADFRQLNDKDRFDLNYWLANAFFHIGMYNLAKDIILSNTISLMDDRFQFLLAMTYEAQDKPEKAQEAYKKMIHQFPDSEYTVSAQIKTRILARR